VTSALEPTALQQNGEIAPGDVLGRYELLLPIASGGMAMVWAARLKGSRGFQKIVAVKTMLPRLSDDEQFEQMFLDEASLASQIRHPHVVEILDLGEQQHVLFLVMEWIDGVPLNQLMKAARPKGGVPISVAVRIAIQSCAGLHAAHELKDPNGKLVGLVHRDISPQNILVTYDGVSKVVDFGVAKATALGGGATVAGQIKGKVAYMAPEQVRGGAIDRRVDVFAMGIVLYALTTGKHPFRRESEAATMYNICAPQPVIPPRKVVADYPVELEQVVLRALAKDPDKRYQTSNDMLRALDQFLRYSEQAPTMRWGNS
jgi:serine/threonine protein kinase